MTATNGKEAPAPQLPRLLLVLLASVLVCAALVSGLAYLEVFPGQREDPHALDGDLRDCLLHKIQFKTQKLELEAKILESNQTLAELTRNLSALIAKATPARNKPLGKSARILSALMKKFAHYTLQNKYISRKLGRVKQAEKQMFVKNMEFKIFNEMYAILHRAILAPSTVQPTPQVEIVGSGFVTSAKIPTAKIGANGANSMNTSAAEAAQSPEHSLSPIAAAAQGQNISSSALPLTPNGQQSPQSNLNADASTAGAAKSSQLNVSNQKIEATSDGPPTPPTEVGRLTPGSSLELSAIKSLESSANMELKGIMLEIEMLRNSSLGEEHELCKTEYMLSKEMTGVLAAKDNKRDSLYFVEDSGSGFIRPRFVCALESAAKAYPNADVYLILAFSPVLKLNATLNEPLYNVVTRYKNVQLLHADLPKLFNNTPLHHLYTSGKINSSKHAGQIIQLVTVWKFGGKTFDLDIVTFKSLELNMSFVTSEGPLNRTSLTNGAFGFPKNSTLGLIYMQMLSASFDAGDWNGAATLTKAVLNYTGLANKEMIANRSNLTGGLKYLNHDLFFPLSYGELPWYFDESRSNRTMTKINGNKDLLGVHISHSGTSSSEVRVGSNQPYSEIAKKHCPRAYWFCYTLF